mmetsp:Transcript_792/g.2307  ORF Transcript_792/g.2307 Transcript_792/m.2307 type:complete len:536 (-) Transcript_792:29-1636(-)
MLAAFGSLRAARVAATARRGSAIKTSNEGFDYLREILNSRVYDAAIESPLTPATSLSAKTGCEVFIKREDCQPVFSFKIRGAYNKIVSLDAEARARGVVACSAGNHAQGVARSCALLGIPAVIVMPLATPRIKVDAVARHGGDMVDVRLEGNTYDEAAAEAHRLVREDGLTLIHPFDDPLVIAGQGSVGAEILRQTNGRRLDAIFCCCGGGGLLAGVAAYVKQVRPDVKVYGVEAFDAAGMTASLEKGERVVLESVGLFADGAAVKAIGEETFRLASRYVDGMITVDNDDICAAIKSGFEDTRCVLEPAGALAVAGVAKHARTLDLEHDTPCFVAVASGANMDFDRLRFVSERADQSEVRLAVKVPETPGAFRAFYDNIYPCNVTEFSYRFHKPNAPADIIVAFQPRTNTFMDRLAKAGYEPRDVTKDTLTSSHLRHVAGGRSPHVGAERLFRFEFPEAPGALKKFLSHFGDGFLNVSLFHYRNYGHDFGRVLVGFQADRSPEADAKLDAFLSDLGYRYAEETDNETYRQFLTSD